MAAGALVKNFGTMIDTAAFGIRRNEINPAQTGEGYCSGAHGAGFQRDVEIAVRQPRRAFLGCCFPNNQYFRVGGGIVQFLGAVTFAGQNLPLFVDQYSAYGDFAPGCRQFCFRQSLRHEIRFHEAKVADVMSGVKSGQFLPIARNRVAS